MQEEADLSSVRSAMTAGELIIRPLACRRGLILAGEADIRSRHVLHDALGEIAADGTGEFHLDLAELRFIDVSCTREIIMAAEQQPGAQLVLHHPSRALRRISALLRPEAVRCCPSEM